MKVNISISFNGVVMMLGGGAGDRGDRYKTCDI